MKIPKPLPVKMGSGLKFQRRQNSCLSDPAVACIILFGDNYTSFMTMDRWNSRSLFSNDEPEAGPNAAPVDGAPLAERMRPRSLAEFVGQEHLVGEGRILR